MDRLECKRAQKGTQKAIGPLRSSGLDAHLPVRSRRGLVTQVICSSATISTNNNAEKVGIAAVVIKIGPLRHRSVQDSDQLRDVAATAEVLFGITQSEAAAIVRGLDPAEHSLFGAKLTVSVYSRLWKERSKTADCKWPIRPPPVPDLKGFPGLVERFAHTLMALPSDRAGYLLGRLYTGLLPDSQRRALGAYYTPPALAERLLALISQSGFDWTKGKIIDPSCGGAAFLVPLARKILAESRLRTPDQKLNLIEDRLSGIDLDPAAAWLSMALLDLELMETCVAAGRPLRSLVKVEDALSCRATEQYDLVIGNPPYGKVGLSEEQRKRFKTSLFGHANLYGLFTHLAVRFARPGGLMAFVTPTSFLGGEYFKNLRSMLSLSAPLERVDFVTAREGIFDNVLQETMLAVFGKLPRPFSSTVHVSSVECSPEGAARIESVGTAETPPQGGAAWLLPRNETHVNLIRRFTHLKHRLSDYGFDVSTGQLVWNRHKEQLSASFRPGCFPIIWAEAVNPDGSFRFQAARRTHLPYLMLRDQQEWLVNSEPCILVQRTTAKEQKRRLVAALIPNSFLCEYPGYVVENHLNMIYSRSPRNKIALRTILALLNSSALDEGFRCINGSVAVSAYELNSLPLPDPDQMQHLQKLVLTRRNKSEVDMQIANFYGIDQPEPPDRTGLAKHDRRVAA